MTCGRGRKASVNEETTERRRKREAHHRHRRMPPTRRAVRNLEHLLTYDIPNRFWYRSEPPLVQSLIPGRIELYSIRRCCRSGLVTSYRRIMRIMRHELCESSPPTPRRLSPRSGRRPIRRRPCVSFPGAEFGVERAEEAVELSGGVEDGVVGCVRVGRETEVEGGWGGEGWKSTGEGVGGELGGGSGGGGSDGLGRVL